MTQVKKGFHGTSVEDYIDLPNIPSVRDEAGIMRTPRLRLSTYKGHRGLTANASVMWCAEGSETHLICGDFSKCYATGLGRATEKALLELHGKMMAQIETIKSDAVSYYANRVMGEAA